MAWPLLVLLPLGLIIAAIALSSYEREAKARQQDALRNLQTVADLKVDAIARSLAGQRARAVILGRAPTFVEFLRGAPDGGEGVDRAPIHGFLEEVRASAGLNNVLLMNDSGVRVAAAYDDRSDDPVWNEAAKRAAATGKMVLIDFRRNVKNGGIDLGYATPIIAIGDSTHKVLGVVVLDLAASSLLDLKLSVWPLPSEAAAAMLVRKEGDHLLELGGSGGGGNTRIELRSLPGGANVIAARVLDGTTGPMVGRDARGIQVLSASAVLPGTSWTLLVTLDRREALAELTRLWTGAGVLILAALVASVTFIFFLEQRRQLQAALAEMAHSRALRAAETQFRAVFEQAAVGIALLAPNRRWLQVNRRLCDMLGYAERDLFARTDLDVTHPDDRAGSQALIRRLDSGEISDFATERRYLAGDGHIVWATTVVRLVRKADGAPDYYISVMEDITERKRAEQQLRESELRFREVVEASPNAMVMTDRNGKIGLVNRQAETLFGHARADLLGRPIEILVPERFRRAHAGLHVAFFAAPRARMMGAGRELFGQKSDGSEVPLEVGITPTKAEDGMMVLATIIDITDRKRQEEALKKSEEQLRQSQKMEAIGNLTGGMAHDFNNLLGVIIGNLDLALPALEKTGEAGELVHEALDAAFRGADLTRRLLAFARRQPLRPQRVAINELVVGTVRLLSRTLGEDIRTSADLAEELWPVVADPVQVEAALANLATNARDAMPSGGSLKIATANRHLDADYVALHPDAAPGDYVMIEVTDTGVGMKPEVMAHIFEPFFTTKEVGKGTGLGLAMVFGFMKQSGGHVNVYSEPGGRDHVSPLSAASGSGRGRAARDGELCAEPRQRRASARRRG